MKEFRVEVVVAGAGITGITLAHLLSVNGISCLVLDQSGGYEPTVSYDPRAISITPASARVLSSINIWQKLPLDKIGKYHGIHVWDEHSNGEIYFDCADICEPVLGYIIEQTQLQNTLYQAMSYNPNILHLTQERVSSINNQENNIIIETDNGVCIKADLLVAADGINSGVRSIAGLDFLQHDYCQKAIACVVKTSLPHENIARQRFLSRGPLAFLPMVDPHTCAIVWSTEPVVAKGLLELDDEAFAGQLQQAFEFRLGDVISCQPRVEFSLFRANANRYFDGRCVLVGDAAHNVHPMAGQGANMGILDIASLAELVVTAKKANRNIASRTVLRRYERWRKAENNQMILAMEATKYLFEQNNDLINNLKSTGLNVINSLPIVKGSIMRYAMGLAGNVPSLIRNSSFHGEL
jgi:2-polyprenylphenol 6-hydroxylase